MWDRLDTLGRLRSGGAPDGAQAQIKFGVAGPITGPNASFGAQLTNGAGQAVEDFNKAGGILGQKSSLSQGDDVSDPKQGVSVANKFVGDGVQFVIGHFNSGVTIPASEVYVDNDILFISPSATNPKVTERGCGTPSAPAAATTSRASCGPTSRSTTSRTRRSPSFTTRPPTARASPTPRAAS